MSASSPSDAGTPVPLDANAVVLTPEEKDQVASKLQTAREKKDVADGAFKEGDLKSGASPETPLPSRTGPSKSSPNAALRSYHEALMYLHGLDKNALKSLGLAVPSPSASSAVDQAASAKDEKTEVDLMLEKIYANMSACHLKQENWKRAIDTADKAIEKNPANSKALFRKGKALGELGYYEKAEAVLAEAKKIAPSEALSVDAELARQRAADRERQKVHDQKLRGWLSREKKLEGA